MFRLSVLLMVLCAFAFTGCGGQPEEKKDTVKIDQKRIDKMKQTKEE